MECHKLSTYSALNIAELSKTDHTLTHAYTACNTNCLYQGGQYPKPHSRQIHVRFIMLQHVGLRGYIL